MGLTFKISGKNFDTYDKAGAYMNSTIVEYIEGIEVIKAFGCAGVFYEKYAKAITDFRTLEMPELPQPKERAAVQGTGVELKDVSFSYTGRAEDEVLHGVNLKLPQGSFTALVGPSGGGKSTVAKLIARFWDVSSGSIAIGGVDVRNMPLDQLSEYVSFVTQDHFLFRCSLMENIRLGRPGTTDEEVRAAARGAVRGVHSEIAAGL